MTNKSTKWKKKFIFAYYSKIIIIFPALEELVYEIVETNTDRKPGETFDVRIIDKESEFTVVLKSKGPLRNPIYKYSDSEVMDLEHDNMRRAILSRVCKNINHKYMNGINCIYLNYSR